eukprot:716811-Hanusia_phi.AAC.4
MYPYPFSLFSSDAHGVVPVGHVGASEPGNKPHPLTNPFKVAGTYSEGRGTRLEARLTRSEYYHGVGY